MTLFANWPDCRWRKSICLACSALGVASSAFSGSGWFARVWDLEDGLPNNNIETMVQAPDGYLWVGTPIGLASFDGIQFRGISSTDFVQGGQKGVMAMLWSRAGGLWLAMDRGAIVYLDGDQTKLYLQNDGLPDSMAHTLVEDGEGSLWTAHLGSGLCRIKAGKVENYSDRADLPDGGVTSLVCDTAGRLWWAKGGRVGIYRDDAFDTLARPRGSIQLARAKAGGVWVGSGTKLYHCDDAGTLREVGQFEREHARNAVSAMIEDSSGAVWIGTSFEGLMRYDGSAFENIGTSHDEVKCLIEDREGNIWVGTRGGGLNRIRKRVVQLHGIDDGMPFDVMRSLSEDIKGNLWAVTQNGLLVCRTGATWTTVSTNSGWPRDDLSCVSAAPDGAIWIGTKNGRLHCLRNGKLSTLDRADGLAGSTIHSLLAARNGDVWIGLSGTRSLQRIRGDRITTFQLPRGVRTLRAMTEDARGNIWIGSSRGMLFRACGDELVDESPPKLESSMSIRCLAATQDGSIWIGYAGMGVGLLKDGHHSRIEAEQGLMDDYISQIIPDENGWLWFGSDHGIFKVRQKDLEAVACGRAEKVRSIRYGRGEGISDLQACFGHAPGGILMRNGLAWMPTRSALAEIDTREQRRRLELPKVLFDRVTVDGNVIATYQNLLPGTGKSQVEVASLRAPGLLLRLPPDNRRLEIGFTTLTFAGQENIRFRYRLKGLDPDWLEAGPERHVSYSRLPAGDYLFEARVCSPDGVWNPDGAKLAMVVMPFFWQTWWFRLLLFAGFTLAMASVVRYVSFRRLRQRVQVLEQQAAVERERARIARDIHDDLGNRLTKVSLLTGFAMRDRAAPDVAENHVRQISTTVRQATDALDEIVWAINPRNDTLPHLINYVGQFVVEFLRAADIRCRVDLPDHPPHWTVPAEIRHNLFLVVKEAITNVVRHARADEVQFRMAASDETISVVISDNGCGFHRTSDETEGDGLRNMRQRMSELGGHFRVVSEPGTGTRLLFDCPWSRKER